MRTRALLSCPFRGGIVRCLVGLKRPSEASVFEVPELEIGEGHQLCRWHS